MADKVKVLIVERNGVELEFQEEYELNAENIDFDNTSNGFSATDIQNAVEEIGAAASPGFSFGRSGTVASGTWLRRPGNVPSNRAGVTIGVANPVVTEVACSNRNIDTYDIEVYEHEGDSVNLTLLGTVNIVAARGGIFPVNFPTTQGKQIAVRLSNGTGNVRDLGVDLILKGNN